MYTYDCNQDKNNAFSIAVDSVIGGEKHFHNCLEIVYVLNGELDAHIDGEVYHLTSGQLCAVSCFSTHFYENCKEGQYYLCLIPCRYFREFESIFNANSFCNPIVTDAGEKPFLFVLRSMFYLLNGADVFGNPIGQNRENYRESQLHFLSAYLVNLLICHCDVRLRHRTSSVVAEAVQVIEHNYKSELSTEKVCQMVGCHQKILAHQFIQTMNMSIKDYIDRMRTLEAARLLVTSPQMTLEAIVMESGFNCVRSFLRHFKKYYGCSPTEYRNRKDLSAQERIGQNEQICDENL